MNLRRTLALPVIATVTVVGLAACGGSSNKTSADTHPSSSAASGAATKVVAKGGSGNFCKDIAASLNEGKSIPTQVLTGNPAALKTLIEKARAESEAIVPEAPSAIRADVKTDLTAAVAFYDAVIAAGYDFSKVDPTTLTALSSPQISAANQRITTYISSHCGIDLGAPTATP